MDSIQRNSTILAGIVLLDQLLKWLVQEFSPNTDLGIIWIHEARNTGASFGMLQGSNTPLIFVALMALGLVMLNVKRITKEQELPVTIIAAGIIGNLCDRLFRGYVVDFLDLKWWPSFNIADSAIFIGVFWLIIIIWKEDASQKNKDKNNDEGANRKNKRKKQKG